MRTLVKILVVFAILVFALFNYRFLTFSQGISQHNFEDQSVLEAMQTLSNIKTVQYYHKTFVSKSDDDKSQYIYRVYLETDDAAYLLDATQDDIDMFETLGIFNSKLQPKKITPIPFYVEIVVSIIVLILPFGRRRKKKAK